VIFSTSDIILAQCFLGIQQNQCFALFQRRRLCDDVFSTLADEFGDFGLRQIVVAKTAAPRSTRSAFNTALNEGNQAIGHKKQGMICPLRANVGQP